jgi:hypothetical protein
MKIRNKTTNDLTSSLPPLPLVGNEAKTLDSFDLQNNPVYQGALFYYLEQDVIELLDGNDVAISSTYTSTWNRLINNQLEQVSETYRDDIRLLNEYINK